MYKSVLKHIPYLIVLISIILMACKRSEDNSWNNSKLYPIADGTFIQDYLVAKWDDAQCKKSWDI